MRRNQEDIETAERFAAWAQSQEEFHNEKLVDAAAGYAVCAAAIPESHDALLDKCLALLTQAKTAGHFNQENIQKLRAPGAFDGIQNNEIFAAFVQEAEKAATQP
ncbi:MAG: hypothetical protein R3C18_10590 [Planctomycetaceae bacterium]